MERSVARANRGLSELSLDELETAWQKAKSQDPE
jgi:hypothetical protein